MAHEACKLETTYVSFRLARAPSACAGDDAFRERTIKRRIWVSSHSATGRGICRHGMTHEHMLVVTQLVFGFFVSSCTSFIPLQVQHGTNSAVVFVAGYHGGAVEFDG